MTPQELQALLAKAQESKPEPSPPPQEPAPRPERKKEPVNYDPLDAPPTTKDPLRPPAPPVPVQASPPKEEPEPEIPPPEKRAQGWRPLPPQSVDPIPEAPEGIPHAVEWDADLADKLDMPSLGEQIRDYQSTVFALEGDQRLKGLVYRQGNRKYGRFGNQISVPQMEDELTLANIQATLRRLRVEDLYSLPPEEQQMIREAATDSARRTVAGIVGVSQRRNNVVVDLDPDETTRALQEGEGWLGLVTGTWAQNVVRDVAASAGMATGLLDSEKDRIPLVDDAIAVSRRFWAPFLCYFNTWCSKCPAPR